jgi:hypothetical protein
MAEQKSPFWGGVAVPGDLAGGLWAWDALLPARQEPSHATEGGSGSLRVGELPPEAPATDAPFRRWA